MGGGLVVVAAMPPVAAQESGRGGQRGGAPPADLASWLHIDERERVTAYTGKVEIGQNVRTSLAQAVADELAVSIASVLLVMADTGLTPYDQGTFGSQTTPRMAPVLARAAATAQEMLIDQAAAAWQVDRQTLSARDGTIAASGGRSVTYGELTRGRKLVGTAAIDPAGASAARRFARSTAATSSPGGIPTPPTWCATACTSAGSCARRRTAPRCGASTTRRRAQLPG
jgi:isoquinoline 1-oxidoreductase